MTPKLFESKDPAEKVMLTFDFTLDIGSEAITAQVCTVTTIMGTDASPSNVLDGAATNNGAKVFQNVKAGNDQCDYDVVCQVTTNGGHIFKLAGILPVRTK